MKGNGAEKGNGRYNDGKFSFGQFCSFASFKASSKLILVMASTFPKIRGGVSQKWLPPEA